MLPPGRAGTWRTLWGDEDGGQVVAALADLASPSLFGGPQVLVVRRAEVLREDAEAGILAALPTLGVGGCLILVAASADQRRKLLAACVRAGAAFGFTRPGREWEVSRWVTPWVTRLAREQGHEIAPAAVTELVERTGADLGVLAGELEKLSLHVGPGTRLELAHVRDLVGATRAHYIDELTNRLLAGDLPGAVRALRQVVETGEPPIKVLAWVGGTLRRALHVAELAEEGLPAGEIRARLNISSDWLLDRMRARASAAELLRALGVLRRLDLELKSGRPEGAVLDAALLEIARGAR